MPYLAYVLGAAGWGLVAFAQAFAQYLTLFIEYGFNFSATREVSRERENPDRLSEILAGVIGAKVVLALIAVLITVVAGAAVPVFRDHPELLWSSVFFAVAFANRPLWYYEGLERMRQVAIFDIATKVVAVAAILVLVRSPGDGWKVLVAYGVSALLSSAFAYRFAYRDIPFRLPTVGLAWDSLRMGFSLFIFHGTTKIYGVGGTFLLGLFAAPEIVGYYAGAEKISKVLLGLNDPVTRTLYPRINHLVHESREQAVRMVRYAVAALTAGGLLISSCVFLLAPIVVPLMLGSEFEPSIEILRILAILLPLLGLSTSLGVYWMLPLGLDRQMKGIVISTGILYVLLVVVLTPPFAAAGTAWALVIAEIYATGAILTVLHRRRLNPFRLGDVSQRMKGMSPLEHSAHNSN